MLDKMHKSTSETNFKTYRKEIGVERKNGEVRTICMLLYIVLGVAYLCSSRYLYLSAMTNIRLHCWKTQSRRRAGILNTS